MTPPTLIPIDELVATWTGLTAVMDWYETGGEGWRALVEARRLVEVEIRAQYGEAAWEREVADRR